MPEIQPVPEHSLPRDVKSPVSGRGRASHAFSIGPEVARVLIQRSDVSDRMAGAFLSLLYRYTGESDLVVGRFDGTRSDLRALRVRVSDETPFSGLVEAVRHGSTPADAVNATIPVRFRVSPVLEAADDPGGALGLSVNLSPEGIHARFFFDAGRFEPAFVEYLAGHFARLVASAVGKPETALADVEMLPPDEEQRIITWESGDPVLSDEARGFAFASQAARWPERIAVEFEGGKLTYAELDACSNQVGHALRRKGVALDVPVMLRFERSPELVIAALAVLKAGGSIVFLDPQAPQERVRLLIEVARPGLVVLGGPAPYGLGWYGCPVASFGELAEGPSSWRASPPVGDLPPDRTALLLPTSGSTGRPRLVRATLAYLRPWADFGPDDRHVLKSDSGTTFTSAELTRPIRSGGTLVIAPKGLERDARRLVEFVGDRKITCLIATPTQLMEILDLPDLSACESLRVVECAGERWPEGLGERFAERLGGRVRLLSTYGCTEAPGATSRAYSPRDAGRGIVDVGRPTPGMEVLVLDRRGRRSPVGVPGTIFIGGLISPGYAGDEEEAGRDRFVPHPILGAAGPRVFRTGDRGRWLPEGNLELLGREDDQLKVRGHRVEPGEVEARLLEDPRVAQCAVAVRDGPRGEQVLVAYWVPRDGATATASSLRRHLQGRLPEAIIPSRFVVQERLPRTSNGKLDRRALPDLGDARPELDAPFAPPATPTEKALHDLWAELLGLDRVGIDDDFFELGGHSLLAARMFSRIATGLKADLPLSILFRRSTIRGLAARIDGGPVSGETDRVVPIRPGGTKRPLFLLHSQWGHLLYCRDLVSGLDPERPVYGIQPEWRDGVIETFSRFEDLAAAHVAALRRAQPVGPYALAGYSFGGLVAFEMAKVLISSDERVSFLGLIDTLGPGYPDTLPAWRRLMLHVEALRAMRQGTALGYLARRARNLVERVFPPRPAAAAEWAQPEAGEVPSWPVPEPRPYPGPLTILRAERQPDWFGTLPDATLGWSRLALGPLEVRVVPGDHLTVLTPPNVAFLSRVLSECLDEADRGEGSPG